MDNITQNIIKEKYSNSYYSIWRSKYKLSRPMYLKPKDKRYERNRKQLKKRGYSDSETWSLYVPIAEFIIPRLVRFRKITMSYPVEFNDIKQWHEILDDMIYAFVWSLEYEDWPKNLNKSEEKKHWMKCRKGMEHFTNYFMHLWW